MTQHSHGDLFADLRQAVDGIQDETERERVRQALADVEGSAGHPTFAEKHAVLMEALNEQATVFAQYLPALTRLLG